MQPGSQPQSSGCMVPPNTIPYGSRFLQHPGCVICQIIALRNWYWQRLKRVIWQPEAQEYCVISDSVSDTALTVWKWTLKPDSWPADPVCAWGPSIRVVVHAWTCT